MEITTIEIYSQDKQWWNKCKKIKNMKSAKLFNRIKEECRLNHAREFYLSLPDPKTVKTNKPLLNKKIRKNYRKIWCL
jgi:hypothetical protein